MYQTSKYHSYGWEKELFQKTVEEYQKGEIKKRQTGCCVSVPIAIKFHA